MCDVLPTDVSTLFQSEGGSSLDMGLKALSNNDEEAEELEEMVLTSSVGQSFNPRTTFGGLGMGKVPIGDVRFFSDVESAFSLSKGVHSHAAGAMDYLNLNHHLEFSDQSFDDSDFLPQFLEEHR